VDLRSGSDASRGLEDLVNAIRGTPSGPDTPIEPREDVSPYRGLRVFEEEHARFFFGRAGDVQRLLERLRHGRFIAVLGVSGSGKSSLTRAGLVPALRAGGLPGSEGWRICVIRPGAHPLEALASAAVALGDARGMGSALADLARGDRGLHLAVQFALADHPQDERAVVVVDQLEEAFTLCDEARERRRAFDNLVYAASRPGGRCVVIVTMRADFYPRLAEHRELAQLVESAQELVGGLSDDELRQAIEGPAHRVGLELQNGLPEAILEDAGRDPGALPLLEHALLETWRRRHAGMLTLEGYIASGGVQGALAERAEEVYGKLTDRQEVARRLLLRLTRPGVGVEDTRRRAPLGELLDAGAERPAIEEVISRFTDARLLTSGRDEAGRSWVEVAHEALIRGWPRLQGWIDDSRRALVIQRRLTEAAEDWERVGRDEGVLFRGARLTEARESPARSDLGVTHLEREFLDASLERERRERGARRRRVAIAFASLALALVAIGAVAVVALERSREAVGQRNIAISRGLALQSANTLGNDPALAITLALRALDKSPTDQAAAALRQATLTYRELAVLRADSKTAHTAAFSRHGSHAVSGGTDGIVRVWDVGTRRVTARLAAGHSSVRAARFSPDGQRLVLGFEDGALAVTDTSLGALRVVLHVRDHAILSVAFSGDGTTLAAAASDGTVRVLAADGRGPARILRGHEDEVVGIDLSPDGDRAVSASKDGSVRLWDAKNGQAVRVLHTGETPETAVRFSPNGKQIVGVGFDGWVRLWDASSGAPVRRLSGEGRELLAAAFSPDGHRVAAAGQDGVIRVWSVAGGPPVAVLRGQRSSVLDIGFGPASDRLISAGDDGTVRIWDAGRVQTWSAPITGIDFNPDGRLIAGGGGDDGTVRVWDAATGRLRARLLGPEGYTAARFSLNDDRVVIASDQPNVRIWPVSADAAQVVVKLPAGRWLNAARFDSSGDRIVYADDGRNRSSRVVVRNLRSGREVALGGVPKDQVWDAQFSPDGEHVAAVFESGAVMVWRVDRPAKSERELRGHGGHLNALAYSRDGQIATAGADGTVRVWSPGGPEVVLQGHDESVTTVVFTPNGRRVLSSSQDGTVRLWDGGGGEALAVLETSEGAVYDVALSRDGKIATLGKDGVVRVFRCDVCGSLAQVRALARSRVARPLTPAERQRFLAATR
jgi:WD40 repeat protein